MIVPRVNLREPNGLKERRSTPVRCVKTCSSTFTSMVDLKDSFGQSPVCRSNVSGTVKHDESKREESL